MGKLEEVAGRGDEGNKGDIFGHKCTFCGDYYTGPREKYCLNCGHEYYMDMVSRLKPGTKP